MVVGKILDGLEVFDSEEEAKKGENPKSMPRLGFGSAPLTIHVAVDRSTGRVVLTQSGAEGDIPVRVESPGLGEGAAFELAKALYFRLRKRDFLAQGRDVVLRPSAVPGSDPVGRVTIFLPALRQDPDHPERDRQERDLRQESMVLQDMAAMWACTEITIDDLDAREFGMSYWVDRDNNLHRNPEARFVKSAPQTDDGWRTNLPCGPEFHRVGYSVGTAHTHPEGNPNPSGPDMELAKGGACGRQHFVVSKDKVAAYFSNQSPQPIGDRKSVLPSGLKCAEQNLE